MTVQKVIYDFGANNGDDIPYYLLRGDKVVAIEANPALVARIEHRFAAEIAAGRVIVEGVVCSVDPNSGTVPFHIHKHNHVLSQFPTPDDPSQFDRVELPSATPHALVSRHGAPHYIKIDVEHYDDAILRDLFAHDIRPPYISVELHAAKVFCTLVALGGYGHFKLVDGITVVDRYGRMQLDVAGTRTHYAFPYHSAGPFGDDIAGDWLGTDQILDLIAYQRLGWRDLHATMQPTAIQSGDTPLWPYLKALTKRALRQRFRS